MMLIQAPPRFSAPNPPLGLMYIASYLEMHGFSVYIESVGKMSKNKFIRALDQKNPRIVGISSMTESFPSAIQIAKAVKQWDSETTIVFGGPHVTFVDREPLETGVVDIVVRHEGEITMLDLADRIIRGRGKKLSEINGITCATKNQSNETVIKRNPPRPLISNLDALPFPARHLIDLELYQYPSTILTSRGCTAKCIYCAARAMSGNMFRYRSPENVMSEILYLYNEYNSEHLQIVDDAFTTNRRRANDICDYLINANFEITWESISRVDQINQNLLKKMANAGCLTIQFGIESGNSYVLKQIGKGITLRQAEEAVRGTRNEGILPVCTFMLGHHVDNKKTVEDTLRFADYLRSKYDALICFSINTPFPGTYMYNNTEEIGITFQTKNWADFTLLTPVISTVHFRLDELRNLFFKLKERFDDAQDVEIFNRTGGFKSGRY